MTARSELPLPEPSLPNVMRPELPTQPRAKRQSFSVIKTWDWGTVDGAPSVIYLSSVLIIVLWLWRDTMTQAILTKESI